MKKAGNDRRGVLERIAVALEELVKLQRMTLGYTATEATETPFQVEPEPDPVVPENPEDVETWLMQATNEMSAEQERVDERKGTRPRW